MGKKADSTRSDPVVDPLKAKILSLTWDGLRQFRDRRLRRRMDAGVDLGLVLAEVADNAGMVWREGVRCLRPARFLRQCPLPVLRNGRRIWRSPLYGVQQDPEGFQCAKGRARVSTNGWIQVFGSDGDWILVQYDITKEHNRIGYIYKNALPRDVDVPEIQWKNAAAVVNYDVEVTDDPLVSQTPLAKLTENTRVTCLGTMGAWTYIESEEKGVPFRGFVPTECLSGTVTKLREANQAIIGSWKLYVGSSIDASRIVFNEDGTMTGQSTLENGREVEWEGSWSLDYYDANRNRYWNESEFELTLSRGSNVELYGLRICRQGVVDGQYKYALILSDGKKTSGMVCE